MFISTVKQVFLLKLIKGIRFYIHSFNFIVLLLSRNRYFIWFSVSCKDGICGSQNKDELNPSKLFVLNVANIHLYTNLHHCLVGFSNTLYIHDKDKNNKGIARKHLAQNDFSIIKLTSFIFWLFILSTDSSQNGRYQF